MFYLKIKMIRNCIFKQKKKFIKKKRLKKIVLFKAAKRIN